MKLSYKQIDPFLKSPDPNARAILVYGPDEGLVRTRSKILAKHFVDDLNDPFNVADLDGESLADEPGKIIDELNTGSMLGGSRVIFVQKGADILTNTLKSYLEEPSQDNILIILSGNLMPKSSLRGLFEKSKAAAALPCYVADQGALKSVIASKLKHAGYSIEPDAQIYLSNALVGDHAQALSELEKLVLYMGWPAGYDGFEGEAVSTPSGRITLEDAQNNTGNLSEQKLDTLCDGVGLGLVERVDETLSLLLAEETVPIIILRSLMNHFKSLHVTNLRVHEGMNTKEAMKKLYPPVFFKREQAFIDQINRWGVEKSAKALEKLNECEAQTKTNIKNPAMILSRCLTGLCVLAHKRY